MFRKLAGLTAIAGLFFVGTASAALNGSAHDFSDQTGTTDDWNTSGEQCVVCHTTHNTDITVGEAPLWNHDLTDTTSGYQMYTGFDMQATSVSAPDGISLLCMGCHDGVVAVDSYGDNTGTRVMSSINTAANVSKDLRNDHPVSIVYNDALWTADGGGLKQPSVTTAVTDLLAAGSKIQCSSCHDVHNTAGFDSLLVMSNAGSALCNTCHTK
jgi:predicted CXXCH cytochrome family protein